VIVFSEQLQVSISVQVAKIQLSKVASGLEYVRDATF
jgi:hypothetical protein